MPKFKENPSPLKYGRKSSTFKMKGWSPFHQEVPEAETEEETENREGCIAAGGEWLNGKCNMGILPEVVVKPKTPRGPTKY